ncbi:MAG: rhomboid family intramembrane serine protease [Flavobacteriales bacterium]|nr:rhomboid family intramembrane serine protease [Flavobacteriales bacterium]
MQNKSTPVKDDSPGPWKSLLVGFLASCSLLVVFVIDRWGQLKLWRFALVPRDVSGLIGVITAPFIHGSWGHLMSNFSAVFALVSLSYFYFKSFFPSLIFFIWVASGLWTWGFARPHYHLGASGIVYGLAAFCFASGIVSRNFRLRALALLVAFLYGGLVWGIWPLPFNESISWEMHLSGLLSGVLAVFLFRDDLPRPEKPSWEEEPEEDLEDPPDAYWKVPYEEKP